MLPFVVQTHGVRQSYQIGRASIIAIARGHGGAVIARLRKKRAAAMELAHAH